MSTAVETLPSRHRVWWKGWLIALIAAAMVAAAFGAYVALRSGAESSPTIVQTVRPSQPLTGGKSLQPGAPARGPVIAESRDVGGISGIVSKPTLRLGDRGATDSGPSSRPPAGSSSNCLDTVRGRPC